MLAVVDADAMRTITDRGVSGDWKVAPEVVQFGACFPGAEDLSWDLGISRKSSEVLRPAVPRESVRRGVREPNRQRRTARGRAARPSGARGALDAYQRAMQECRVQFPKSPESPLGLLFRESRVQEKLAGKR